MRHNTRYCQKNEQYGTRHGHDESDISIMNYAYNTSYQIGNYSLIPKVNGSTTKTTDCADQMDNAHICLLKIADDADS